MFHSRFIYKKKLLWSSMKENMGIQPKNIPEKICDKRKTQ